MNDGSTRARTCLAALLLVPLRAQAEEAVAFHPFVSLSGGIGFAQDNAVISVPSQGGGTPGTASLNGVAAVGGVLGVNAGLDLRHGDLFAGARVGYLHSWMQQSLDATLPDAGLRLQAQGSLDDSILVLARLGWTVSTVPIYVTGGWVWSWASARLSENGAASSTHTFRQNGPAVGLGIQPGLCDAWFLELEYLVVIYGTVPLPEVPLTLATADVNSIGSTFTVSAGYRF